MITIRENIAEKVPGDTSIYIQMAYNEPFLRIIEPLECKYFCKKNHTWEFPLTDLAYLIDRLVLEDTLELVLLEDQKSTEKTIHLDTSTLITKPFPYQVEGIEYGLNHDKWLLLDEPGLGKTLQTLYVAQALKKQVDLKHCLIICGLNILKENWRKEIQKHTNLSCRVLGEYIQKNGKRKIGGIPQRLEQLSNPIEEFFVITNIETLRNDDIIKALQSSVNSFDMIIFDEIHACKDSQSHQGKNLLKLDSVYKIGCTGTPLVNNALDAYVPLKWIGAEHSTLTNFKRYYCRFGGPTHNIIVGMKNLDFLKYQLEKNSLRRSKNLLNLPPKTVINEYVTMEDRQALFYENIKSGIKDQVNKVKLNTTNLLALTARLRQATACPSILTTENIPSAKLDRAESLVDEIVSSGNKVVIFSTFKETTKKLAERLAFYHPVVLTGDTKDVETSALIEQFQKDPSTNILICTWQKVGTGVTLTAATYEIFIDTPYTYAAYEQAQDRCHRVGTKSNVTVYNLITADTVDERVLQILENKSALADYVVDDVLNEENLKILQKYIEDL